MVDRIEPHIFAKPCNYGFIPQTLDDDGDELDTLVITDEPIPMGAVVKEARVIGVLNFEDDGEMDHKIICVPADDRHNAKLMHHEELGEAWHQQIEHHFTHYKDLKKKGTTTVHGFGTVEDQGRPDRRTHRGPRWIDLFLGHSIRRRQGNDPAVRSQDKENDSLQGRQHEVERPEV